MCLNVVVLVTPSGEGQFPGELRLLEVCQLHAFCGESSDLHAHSKACDGLGRRCVVGCSSVEGADRVWELVLLVEFSLPSFWFCESVGRATGAQCGSTLL